MPTSTSSQPTFSSQPTLAARVKAQALELGFALVGIAPATEADGFAHFRAWLERGYAGEMAYLHKRAEARRHPESILAGVRSVIMVAMEYGGSVQTHKPATAASGSVTTSARNAAAPFHARVAKYAQGPDYHPVMWGRLNRLAAWLEAEVPGCRTAAVTDTAPLLERDFARRAGLGWIGKNTMLIHPRRGSFFFLGALLTDCLLPPDEPFPAVHCGTCTACLKACPTQAFPEPFVLDATRCISYLTIELRSAIPPEQRDAIGDWLFGCDICQDVCPWNRRRVSRAQRPGQTHPQPDQHEVAFPPDPQLEWLDPIELLQSDADNFRQRFKKTSLWRSRRRGLLRNAAIVLGNIGDARALPALEKACCDADEVIRDAAAWAIERIRQRMAKGESRAPAPPGA
ncbi:MAG: tRNA epoxyqueuosine(34) reductase QueG [Gemmataceae bacterium]|nr:tRNA epoxyqueuosine(34) reductase QueG [Gemmata sp.]MDW8198771.1 tRNA epoxyqueuosine(34) reductase QueG [Gemmataceae bacterium]